MIRINKTKYPPPPVLLKEGALECNAYIASYTSASPGYHLADHSARTKFDFSSAIYAHDSVKELLKHIQDHKCCFCEAKVSHISHGDIEHFRPKAAFRQ